MIDAGCGAGAVTVALLRRGAAHVSAWDIVPAAIEDTLENVRRHADPARVTHAPGIVRPPRRCGRPTCS